ncbi:hypothetical protein GY45DRAFT_683684 [Cubamyces sp. BRFM 1775]|nr:hypothetical protein GY45DRAFT_683684 [Cubamyces sp. BRFM 1775]
MCQPEAFFCDHCSPAVCILCAHGPLEPWRIPICPPLLESRSAPTSIKLSSNRHLSPTHGEQTSTGCSLAVPGLLAACEIPVQYTHVCGLISWASGRRSLLGLRRSLGSCRTLRNRMVPNSSPRTLPTDETTRPHRVPRARSDDVDDDDPRHRMRRLWRGKAWQRSTLMPFTLRPCSIRGELGGASAGLLGSPGALVSLERHARRQSDFDFDDISRPWPEAHSARDASPEDDHPRRTRPSSNTILPGPAPSNTPRARSVRQRARIRLPASASEGARFVRFCGEGATENEDEKRRGAISVWGPSRARPRPYKLLTATLRCRTAPRSRRASGRSPFERSRHAPRADVCRLPPSLARPFHPGAEARYVNAPGSLLCGEQQVPC